jgi:N-acetylmuramoyl-L-alanine amidase-like protein
MAQQQQRIIERPEWGARHEDGFGPRRVGDLEVYVHHSVTVAPDLLPPFTDDYAAVRELERIGEARFGKGISYHFPITPAGVIFEGVSIDRIGAAIENYNTPSANIVWVGNYDVATPPRLMLEATDWLLHHGVSKGWWRAPRVAGGHQDAPGAQTACPGRYAEALLGELNRGEYHADGPVLVDNPVTPPSTPTAPATLTVDGRWGSATTRKAQKVLGTLVDGIVSSQSRTWAAANPGLTTGWQWVAPYAARGSRLILAHQELLAERRLYRGDLDGIAGAAYFRALQRDLDQDVIDGEIWNPSATVRALQRRLNTGRI